MFLPRLANLLNRSIQTSNVLKLLTPSTVAPVLSSTTTRPQNVLGLDSGCVPVNQAVQLTQVRTFKDYSVLKLRCRKCYFTKVDDRWWVKCSVFPRHAQRQKVYNYKDGWIVTHITRTGSYKKKHYQYPHQDM